MREGMSYTDAQRALTPKRVMKRLRGIRAIPIIHCSPSIGLTPSPPDLSYHFVNFIKRLRLFFCLSC